MESRLAEGAGYNNDSITEPIARKKENTRKQRHALTPDNVLNELKELDWRILCDASTITDGTRSFGGVLDLPESEGWRIEEMYASDEDRKSAGVLWWVDHHPLASWRLLITRLDEERVHSVANRIHQYAEKVTDHSFTCQNISMVAATVDDDKLAEYILQVPESIQKEIREKTFTSADFREGVIEYYAQYSPKSTWDKLAGRFYRWECGEALAAARRFIKETPETTLNLPNLNTLLERVRYNWFAIGGWMNIPRPQRMKIGALNLGFAQRCSRACWELYLTDHPFPTWQLVAYTLYRLGHLDELEVVLKKYLRGSTENPQPVKPPGQEDVEASPHSKNRLLTEHDLPDLLKELRKHAAKWRDIGTYLRFHPGELDNIQVRPTDLTTAPESWLRAMLTEWLQRAPDDTRGSSSIELLTLALNQCGIVAKLELNSN